MEMRKISREEVEIMEKLDMVLEGMEENGFGSGKRRRWVNGTRRKRGGGGTGFLDRVKYEGKSTDYLEKGV